MTHWEENGWEGGNRLSPPELPPPPVLPLPTALTKAMPLAPNGHRPYHSILLRAPGAQPRTPKPCCSFWEIWGSSCLGTTSPSPSPFPPGPKGGENRPVPSTPRHLPLPAAYFPAEVRAARQSGRVLPRSDLTNISYLGRAAPCSPGARGHGRGAPAKAAAAAPARRNYGARVAS